MNLEHLRTFLWLRWRLLVNQVRRGGIVNTVLLIMLAIGAAGFVLCTFSAAIVLGILVFPNAPPSVLLFTWTGLVVVCLFSWGIGLLTELQRSENLSLTKFLHLPVSLAGAFLINYLSSWLSLTLFLFVPAMVGLSLGLAIGMGPSMLLLLPLTAAFVVMLTALTYQLQGWLASLMANKRRRRTVIVVTTGAFILLCQLPNLINLIVRPWEDGEESETRQALNQERGKLDLALASGQLTPAQHAGQLAQLTLKRTVQDDERGQALLNKFDETTTLITMLVPPGWLPLGAKYLALGNVVPALLGTLGLGLIGTASLWRGYRTTLRLYTGHYTAGKRSPAPVAKPARVGKPGANFLEKQLPWLPDAAAATALQTFQSLLRAPEAKMALLAPIILTIVFGSVFFVNRAEMPDLYRPLPGFGAMVVIMLCMQQIVGNQFGLDRGGFRLFVLSPAPRRDILLGKNLAVAPFACGLCLLMTTIVQVIQPVSPGYFLAALPQVISMYLLFCLLANWLSIIAPMRFAQGTLKASNAKFVPILLQFAVVALFPVVIAPTLIPLGVQLLLDWQQIAPYVPVGLILALLECVAIVFLYRHVLTWQSRMLQARELTILEVVATKSDS